MRPACDSSCPCSRSSLAFPAAAHAADKPNEQALYQDGPEGRYLLDGDWLFRLDNADQGVKQRFMRSTSTAGWTTVKVPNVWNLGDASNESMSGRDRLVPQGLRAAERRLARWPGRCASSRSTTARRCGSTAAASGENTGAYIPFEFGRRAAQAPRDEPARGARRLARGSTATSRPPA